MAPASLMRHNSISLLNEIPDSARKQSHSAFPVHIATAFHISPQIALAFSAYFIGTASPGPSNLAIMSVAMRAGRIPALLFAMGVLMGSAFWSVIASLGLSVLLSECSAALLLIKALGGAYLLWLGVRSAYNALSKNGESAAPSFILENYPRLFFRGMAMHVTNPKAVLVWLSIITLALPDGTTTGHTLAVVSGCWVIGLCVFGSYALLFSTALARQVYLKTRRYLEGGLAALFCWAGVRLLLPDSSAR
jgi:threonine/homoserine/homoserine lactone efflux protein